MSICNFNTVTVKTARSNALLSAIGSGASMKFYTGSPPTDASVAATGTLLATLPLSSTPGVVTTGITGGANPYFTLNAVTSANGVATGTPGYARITTSGGVGVVDLDCGTSGTSIIMTPNTITTGAPVNVTSGVITEQ